MSENMPTEDVPSSLEVLQDLDARQDDVLAQLDDLNDRVEAALLEYGAGKSTETDDSTSLDPVEADVESRGAVRECSDADAVDTTLGDADESLESDAA